MILTGTGPVTTFLAVLRLKCSDTPCGYQEQYRSFREHSPTLVQAKGHLLILLTSSTMIKPNPIRNRRKLGKEICLPMSTTQKPETLYQLQQLDFELDGIYVEQQTLLTLLQGDRTLRNLVTQHT